MLEELELGVALKEARSPLSPSGGRGGFRLLPDRFLLPAGPAFLHPPLTLSQGPLPGAACPPVTRCGRAVSGVSPCSSKAHLEAIPSALLLWWHVAGLPGQAPVELGAVKTQRDLLLLLRDPLS